MPSAIVVGAGICGITSALALQQRGWRVTVLDPAAPEPHPDAASTDVSKVIRADYGADDFYTALMTEAFDGWDRWNADWKRTIGAPLYHETGFLLLAGAPLHPGGFEHDSFVRAPRAQRLAPDDVARRFPAWNARRHPDGYYNPRAGWAESGRVVEVLSAGVLDLRRARVRHLLSDGPDGDVRGVVIGDGTTSQDLRADVVIVAAGTWTWTLVPELSDRMVTVGQPVLHFLPADPRPFSGDVFPVWAADISNLGWYGFPALPDGRVKVANHGAGLPLHPDAPRVMPDHEEPRFRAFLRDAIPALADAPVVFRRICCYSDMFDGDFFIDRHPARAGLVVAAGGSGHLFKFAPVLGDLIANAVEGRADPRLSRFRWRARTAPKREAARSSAT